MRRLAATLLAGTLAASAASAADTIGTLSGRRQQYAPQDPIQVEAIFEELTSLPPMPAPTSLLRAETSRPTASSGWTQ